MDGPCNLTGEKKKKTGNNGFNTHFYTLEFSSISHSGQKEGEWKKAGQQTAHLYLPLIDLNLPHSLSFPSEFSLKFSWSTVSFPEWSPQKRKKNRKLWLIVCANLVFIYLPFCTVYWSLKLWMARSLAFLSFNPALPLCRTGFVKEYPLAVIVFRNIPNYDSNINRSWNMFLRRRM